MLIMKSIQGIFTILIMILAGYFSAYKGWTGKNTSTIFTKLIVNISLPAFMISYIPNNIDKGFLKQFSSGLIVPLLSIGSCYVLSILAGNIIKVNRNRRGIFRSMFSLSNTIFIGLPVNLALFGDKSIPFVLMYYIVNTVFLWTVGVYEISGDDSTGRHKSFSLKTLKRILSPPLVGFFIGISLVQLNIHLPKFILESLVYLGNLTTPLSMIFIGITIYYLNIREIKFSIDMVVLLIGRFIISPLLVIVISYFFPLPALMKSVFVIQSALPTIANAAILSREYNSDYEYAAVMVTMTTVVSLIFIPIYMVILG